MKVLWLFVFITVDISLAEAQVEQVVHVPGERALFQCSQNPNLHPGVKWLVNGSALESLNLSNVMEVDSILLFITLSLEHNMTMISCRANSTEGMMVSMEFLLLIQGLLPPVAFPMLTVQDSAILLTWTAPFSLDITAVDPDIEGYCVDVATSSQTLHSQCGIMETQFPYPAPTGCDRYTFTVIPVNTVGNGTQLSQYYPLNITPPGVLLETVTTAFNKTHIYTLVMSDPVCAAELILMDVDTGVTITIEDSDFTDTNITFTAQQLFKNRHYNITVIAFNLDRQTATSTAMISTYDILELQIMSGVNSILLVAVYLEYSCAAGGLFIIVFVDERGVVDFTRSAYLAVNRTTPLHYTPPSPGEYLVFVYDIEQDGTLQSGVSYPAVTAEFTTPSQERKGFMPPQVQTCDVRISSGYLITAECPRTPRFQLIAQLQGDLRKVHKLYTNKTVDGQTTVSVAAEENGMYQVTIFAIREELGILNSSIEFSGQLLMPALSDEDTTTATTITTTSTAAHTTTSTADNMERSTTLIIIIICLGVLVIFQQLFIIICIGIICFKKLKRHKPKEEGTQENENLPPLYEEIKLSETRAVNLEVATRTAKAPNHGGTILDGAKVEDGDLSGTKSSKLYQITECPAYGVSVKLS